MKLSDALERSRVLTELDRTLLVEAAAGTGKTTVLVDRIINVIAEGITTCLLYTSPSPRD